MGYAQQPSFRTGSSAVKIKSTTPSTNGNETLFEHIFLNLETPEIIWSATSLQHKKYLYFFQSIAEFSIAHMLFTHQVIIYSGLGITNDEECPTDITNFHLLLLSSSKISSLQKE